MFRGELDRRERILDLVRDLPRHFGPRLEPVRALELVPLGLQLGGHAVEGIDEAPQFVRGPYGNPRVEVAAGDAAGRARELADRIGDPLRHGETHAGAEKYEEK